MIDVLAYCVDSSVLLLSSSLVMSATYAVYYAYMNDLMYVGKCVVIHKAADITYLPKVHIVVWYVSLDTACRIGQ